MKRPQHLRGFTLIELVVALGILLILGFIAVSAYYSSLAASNDNTAFNRLATAAATIQSSHAANKEPTFTRTSVTNAIEDTFASAGNKISDDLLPTTFVTAPQTSTNFSRWAIGFDDNNHVVSQSSGSRVAIYTQTPTGRGLVAIARTVDTHSPASLKPLVCFVRDDAPTTPRDFLLASNPGTFCVADHP